MSEDIHLPKLMLFDDYENDWNTYLNALYERFAIDFLKHRPQFNGKSVGTKNHPMINDKSATFWHLISEGLIEKDRTPDFRRCERIPWPRPLIETGNSHPKVLVWSNQRKSKNGGTEKRIVLFVQDYKYIVILADRKDYLLLWTAYYIEKDHQIAKYLKEYSEYMNNTKSGGTP